MVTSKYEWSNLSPTSKVKLRENKVCEFVIKTYKVISDCLICYPTLALATYMSRDKMVEKYFSKLIDRYKRIICIGFKNYFSLYSSSLYTFIYFLGMFNGIGS